MRSKRGLDSILSDPGRKLRLMQVNPWQRLDRDWPGLTVSYCDLGAQWGLTQWDDGIPVSVVLNERLTQVQKRVTIAHECEHLDRGAPHETLRGSEERRVLAATARYLLPDIDVIAAHLAVYDLHRAADELWVTFPVLIDRLRAMSDEELDYVGARCDFVA